jgi:hypothetical protein
MKATVLLIVIVALAMAVLAAQPVEPGVTHATSHANDPLWMMVSGAALLSLASALRRYMP